MADSIPPYTYRNKLKQFITSEKSVLYGHKTRFKCNVRGIKQHTIRTDFVVVFISSAHLSMSHVMHAMLSFIL